MSSETSSRGTSETSSRGTSETSTRGTSETSSQEVQVRLAHVTGVISQIIIFRSLDFCWCGQILREILLVSIDCRNVQIATLQGLYPRFALQSN